MAIDKKLALENLRKAKGAHIKWRSYAQALVAGVEVNEDKLPVEHTDCAFGKWYHGDGKEQLGSLISYDAIYTPHEMLHEIYKRIYAVLHAEDKGGFFSSKASRDQKKLLEARSIMEELVGVSETLLKTIEILEQEIKELPE